MVARARRHWLPGSHGGGWGVAKAPPPPPPQPALPRFDLVTGVAGWLDADYRATPRWKQQHGGPTLKRPGRETLLLQESREVFDCRAEAINYITYLLLLPPTPADKPARGRAELLRLLHYSEGVIVNGFLDWISSFE